MQRGSIRKPRPEKPMRTVLRNDAIMYMSILSARDLKDTQKIGTQDPYVEVQIVAGGASSPTGNPAFRTSTHDNGGVTPQWNEKTNFIIPDVSTDVVRIRILNENWVGSNVIGETVLAVRDLSRGRSMERDLALTPKGFLKVRMYLSMGHENPNSQARAPGEYPRYFIAGKSKLFCGIIAGEKLRNIQTFGTQDPYCDVYLSKNRNPSSSDLIYRTKTHDNGGKHPKWHEAITATVNCIEHDYLVVRVMNDNHLKDDMIGEMVMKVEVLIGQQFVDKPMPIEADGTIVGQLKLQLALFNDEVLASLDNVNEGDLDGCTCSKKSKGAQRATKVGDVLINGISPSGVPYLEAGTVVHVGCELAGDYVLDKDYYEGEEWDQHEYQAEDFREDSYAQSQHQYDHGDDYDSGDEL